MVRGIFGGQMELEMDAMVWIFVWHGMSGILRSASSRRSYVYLLSSVEAGISS